MEAGVHLFFRHHPLSHTTKINALLHVIFLFVMILYLSTWFRMFSIVVSRLAQSATESPQSDEERLAPARICKEMHLHF